MGRIAAHVRHAKLLRAVRERQVVEELLARSGDALEPAWRGATWTRRFARFTPSDDPLLTVVCEPSTDPNDRALVTIHRERERDAAFVERIAGAWASVRRLVDDPGLTTLGTTRDMPGARLVRYRPFRRCTLRVENESGVRFAKVFPDDRGRAIHEDATALHTAVRAARLPLRIAAPIAWDADARSLWQDAVPGGPVDFDGPTPRIVDLARRMGAALGTLTRLDLVPTETLDREAQLERTHRYADAIAAAVPCLQAPLGTLLDRLAGVHATAERRPLVPIHGSPHVHQWLDDGARLGLVDFDRLSRGDPELDVATFLAEYDFERHPADRVHAVTRALSAGVERVTGPLRPDLLAAYRCHKRLAKALRVARSLRPDAGARAARTVAFAAAALDEPVVETWP